MKPCFAFDTSALISLGQADLVGMILDYCEVIVTSSVMDELRHISELNDDPGKSAAEWLNESHKIRVHEVKEENKQPHAELDLFSLSKRENIPLVTDDLMATKRFMNDIQCFFSVHIVYLLVKKGYISFQKGLLSLERMRIARDWKDNLIYTIGKSLFQ